VHAPEQSVFELAGKLVSDVVTSRCAEVSSARSSK